MASQTSFSFAPLPDLAQLPFLLRLLDDPSPRVRQKIAAQLRQLGASVWPEIESQQLPLTASQHALLETILAPVAIPETNWLEWLHLERETEQLEAALDWLSRQRAKNNATADFALGASLDFLAQEYLSGGGSPDPEELSEFLFREKGLSGPEESDYYTPENSDLRWVLKHKRGLPISLACIFILVAARLDIEVVGCEFPGHFLARAPLGSSDWGENDEADLIFDCYDAGRVLQPFEVAALRKSSPHAMSTPASAKSIVARVLRNYATAHHVQGNRAATLWHLNLLQQLEAAKI